METVARDDRHRDVIGDAHARRGVDDVGVSAPVDVHVLLGAARRLRTCARMFNEGVWGAPLGDALFGRRALIVGFGRIGKAVARRALGFDMRVIFYDPSEKKPNPDLKATPVDFETLLEESDFLSLHTPLTPDTRHLIDSEALSKMKPNAVLVNTARGPIVDQQALYEALKENRIFGAGLDVIAIEGHLRSADGVS